MANRRFSYQLAIAALVVLSACGGGGNGSSSETPNGSAQPYTAGSSVTESLSANPARGPTGGVGRLYTLTLTQQTNLQFTLVANGFPPFLGLYTATGQPIVERPNTNTSFKAFLPAGTYQLFVDSTNDASGTFTLSSAPAQPGPCLVPGGVETPIDNLHTVRGANLAGTVTSADCGDSLAKVHVYELPLKAGETITVSFTTNKMSGINFWNTTGTQLAGKEMAGAGSGSFSYTVTSAGYYGVLVESRTANGVSSLPVTYTITIQ